MSDKNKTHKDLIREMVLSLSRGDLDAARKASRNVLEAKASSALQRMDAEIEAELEEEGGAMMRAGKRHLRGGKKHMAAMDRKRKKMLRDKHDVKEMNDTGSDSGVLSGKYDRGYHDSTSKKGADGQSGVKKSGKIDHADYDGDAPNAYDVDNPKTKGSNIKKSGKIDHKDYDGDAPNAYDEDDPKTMNKKPVNK